MEWVNFCAFNKLIQCCNVKKKKKIFEILRRMKNTDNSLARNGSLYVNEYVRESLLKKKIIIFFLPLAKECIKIFLTGLHSPAFIFLFCMWIIYYHEKWCSQFWIYMMFFHLFDLIISNGEFWNYDKKKRMKWRTKNTYL